MKWTETRCYLQEMHIQRNILFVIVTLITGSGSGYTVWVIDTGVHDTHNDFGGRAQQTVNYAGGANVSIF